MRGQLTPVGESARLESGLIPQRVFVNLASCFCVFSPLEATEGVCPAALAPISVRGSLILSALSLHSQKRHFVGDSLVAVPLRPVRPEKPGLGKEPALPAATIVTMTLAGEGQRPCLPVS